MCKKEKIYTIILNKYQIAYLKGVTRTIELFKENNEELNNE